MLTQSTGLALISLAAFSCLNEKSTPSLMMLRQTNTLSLSICLRFQWRYKCVSVYMYACMFSPDCNSSDHNANGWIHSTLIETITTTENAYLSSYLCVHTMVWWKRKRILTATGSDHSCLVWWSSGKHFLKIWYYRSICWKPWKHKVNTITKWSSVFFFFFVRDCNQYVTVCQTLNSSSKNVIKMKSFFKTLI